MQRIATSINHLLGSHPTSVFVSVIALILLSIASQSPQKYGQGSTFGIAFAHAHAHDTNNIGNNHIRSAGEILSNLQDLDNAQKGALGSRSSNAIALDPNAQLPAKHERYSYEHVRRASPIKTIVNNAPVNQGVRPGEIYHYSFLNSGSSSILSHRTSFDNALEVSGAEPLVSDQLDLDQHKAELRRRQSAGRKQRTVYLTINTCTQPDYSLRHDQQDPPQLVLYVSQDAAIKEPGPNSDNSKIITRSLVEGYASVTLNSTNDIYASVYGPPVQVLDDSMWTFDLAASIDEPYHSFVNSSLNLFMIDSDRNAALLITKNLSSGTPQRENTSKWLSHGPPLSIFVQEKNNSAIRGLHQSYCGLNEMASFPGPNVNPASRGIEFGLTKYGGSSLEQQFYIPGLNATSTYYGILARPRPATTTTSGGGGAVYLAMTFSTKRLANCAVVYNLTFCSSIAYAVPANPDRVTSLADLRAIYDSTTAAKYQNFNYSLQQIPCNTTATAQYSLNRTCEDCATAYKKWLCAVSIPRCADWVENPQANKSTSFLQLRNVAQQPIPATPEIKPVTNRTLLNMLATNSSRNNATIAGRIQPGPYAEILPCEDLCYEIVRSCPASFGFGCPYAGRGLEMSYGRRNLEINDGVTCSEPGAVFGLSSARRTVRLSLALVWICVASATSFLFV